jgi:hypothetical protein
MQDRQSKRFGLAVALGATLALLLPAGAAAQQRPVATTGGVANVGQDTVVLNGVVNPRGAETTYFFQYGTTSLYGAQTAPTPAGNGRRNVRVAVPVGGLAPATRYHYRLVAQSRRGLVKGRNRTFRTLRQPLGVTLAANPNPIRAGGPTTLAGNLTGTGNAGRQVVLQSNPFPYTQGFANVGNAQVTDAQGGFAFPLLSVGVNTQFRVLMPQRPEVVSPVVVLGTQVRVSTRVRVRRRTASRRRGRVRFSGTITPAAVGSQILIQKRRRGNWVNVAQTFARHAGDSRSRYVKRIRPRRGGRYRVFANVQGAYVGAVGREVTVRVRRRR